MLVDDLSTIKDIDIYSYNDDNKGNIELNFRVLESGNYRIMISEKDLKFMIKFSRLGKLINKENVE